MQKKSMALIPVLLKKTDLSVLFELATGNFIYGSRANFMLIIFIIFMGVFKGVKSKLS